jgi:hypothetical protein
MKKLILIIISVLFLISCKKSEFSPEGPTDVRIRNLTSDHIFYQVEVKTSDNEGDTGILGDINPGKVSEYSRFSKAYIDIELSAKINVKGSLETFSTGPVDFTYLQYVGQDKITYEVEITDMDARKLKITNRIHESAINN